MVPGRKVRSFHMPLGGKEQVRFAGAGMGIFLPSALLAGGPQVAESGKPGDALNSEKGILPVCCHVYCNGVFYGRARMVDNPSFVTCAEAAVGAPRFRSVRPGVLHHLGCLTKASLMKFRLFGNRHGTLPVQFLIHTRTPHRVPGSVMRAAPPCDQDGDCRQGVWGCVRRRRTRPRCAVPVGYALPLRRDLPGWLLPEFPLRWPLAATATWLFCRTGNADNPTHAGCCLHLW